MDIDWWWLQNHLKLQMLEQTIGVLAITAIGGTPRRLCVTDAVRFGTEHAQESLGRHSSGAHFDVVGLLQDAALFRPVSLQPEDQLLKRQRILRGWQRVVLFVSRG